MKNISKQLNFKSFLNWFFIWNISSSKDGFNYLIMMSPLSHIAGYFNGIFIGTLIYDYGYDNKTFGKIGLNYLIELFVTFYFIIQIPLYYFSKEMLSYNATLFALLPLIVPLIIINTFNRIFLRIECRIPQTLLKIYKEYSVISFFYRSLIFIYVNQLNMSKFHKIIISFSFHPLFCILIKNIFGNKKIKFQ